MIKASILILLITIFCSFTTQPAAAESAVYGEIKGLVIDASSKQPLAGVNVFIEHLTVGAAANLNGEYHILRVPSGKHHLVATMVGYKPAHRDVDVAGDGVISIDFQLERSVLEMGAVVVTGTDGQTRASAQT